MTRNELQIREEAVLAAFYDGDLIKGCSIVSKLYGLSSSKKLYRFRPPHSHDVDALRNGQIYICAGQSSLKI